MHNINYMYCMPNMTMQYEYEKDYELKKMYPKIYRNIYPWVKYYCSRMELEWGDMYVPNRKEISRMCKEIYEKIEDKLEDMEEDYREEDRKDGYGRRRSIDDLISILFIREILGRRRRRRRNRRRRFGYYYY